MSTKILRPIGWIVITAWLMTVVTACTAATEVNPTSITRTDLAPEIAATATPAESTATPTEQSRLSPTVTVKVRPTTTPTNSPRSSSTSTEPTERSTEAPNQPESGSGDTNQEAIGFSGCTGTGPVMFAVSPMRPEDISHLLPYGTLAGAHVTPIDHMYFQPADSSLGRDAYEVRAIQDGVIFDLQPRDVNVDTGQSRQTEWRMVIAHTCTFTSYFDLLTSLDPEIEAEWSKSEGGRTGRWQGIPVKAGQVVGRIGAQTLDFGVYDYESTLSGYIVPAHYERESWKIHTVDPFPYFREDIRTSLLALMLRQVEPRAGKIDYDVEGTLSGNWFQQGTNGYAGSTMGKYWDGHLAIVPDALDPTKWRFSIGNFSGEYGDARQFGILGNSPDPLVVTFETGLIKYELVDSYYVALNDESRHGTGPDGIRAGDDIALINGSQVHGVALLELNADGTLTCEVFPGMSPADVDGFTSSAKLYER